MRRIIPGTRKALFSLAGLLVGLSCLHPSAVRAAEDTSQAVVTRKLKGKFGFAAQGYFGANFDSATQLTQGSYAARVGVYTFDGKGGCHIHSMANKAGLAAAVSQDSTACTYVVYKDGTGMVDATLGGKSFQTFFVLVNKGNEFMFTRREGTDNSDGSGASLVFAIAKRQ